MDWKRRTSKIWTYFTPLDSASARCEICKARVSYKTSISNLKRHKIRKHSTVTVSQDEEIFKIVTPAPTPEILYVKNEDSKPSTSSTKFKWRTSKIWNYFTAIDSASAICNTCKRTVSYKTSISNLKRHKMRKHAAVGSSQDDDVKIPREMSSEQHDVELPHSTEESSKPSTSSDTTNNVYSPTPNQVTQERTISRIVPASSKKKIDDCLIQLFTVDFQPFSIVDDIGFRKLVKALNPTYDLPSRKTIMKTYIPNLYDRCLVNMKRVAENIKSACLTIDSWKSITGDNIMAVTAHFIDDNFKLHTMLLECPQYSSMSQTLSTELQQVIERWKLNDKILICVSDHTPEIKEAVSSLGWTHLGCFAHSLNLIVQDALKVCEDLLKKIRIIAGHFKRCSDSRIQLEEVQMDTGASQKKIVTDVPTRWNSTLHMLESFRDLEDALRDTIPVIGDPELPDLDLDDWQSIKALCKMLKPFEEATQQVSGEKYMPASLVIPITIGLHRVSRKMKESAALNETSQDVLETLDSGVNQVFDNIEFSSNLGISTFLDPRFKNIGFQDVLAADSIKKEIIEHVSEIISKTQIDTLENKSETVESTDEFSIWNSYDLTVSERRPHGTAYSRAVIEVQRYIDDEILDRKADPLSWWNEHCYNYPYLKQIVLEHCCTLATSVPCDRLSSKAGNLFLEWRTRLKGERVNQMLTLNVNRQYL